MSNLLTTLVLSFALAGAAACGGTTSQTAPLDGGGEATTADGGDATTADGGAGCNEQTQIAVNDYAHVTGLGTDSCQPLPATCASHPTCGCVLAAFRCGITTTCDDGTLPLQVTCQPD